MNNKIKLHNFKDIDDLNAIGEVLRTVQVFQCHICGGLTNKVFVNHWTGSGKRSVCPNVNESWHNEMSIHDFEISNICLLKFFEMIVNRIKIRMLRKEFRHLVRNDLEGKCDLRQVLRVTNTHMFVG